MNTSLRQAIPILALHNPSKGVDIMRDLFQFSILSETVDFVEMGLNSQRILITNNAEPVGQIVPDHIALDVPNLDAALAEVISRGGVLSQSYTPNGPLEIREFWENGIRYVFIDGPEGAPIELCQRLGSDHVTTWQHGHIGVKCTNIGSSVSALHDLELSHIANYQLHLDEQTTDVSFDHYGSSMLEFFADGSEVKLEATPWRGLRL